MSDINSHMQKIDTSISLLLSSINNLQKVVEDDSEKTGAKFRITVANTEKCKSLLNILELKVADFLSSNIKSKLSKIHKNTQEIKHACNNMDCKKMMDGFTQLNTLKEELREAYENMKMKTQHLIPHQGQTEETQTQVNEHCFLN